VIELGWPARILNPNGRGHHMAKHRAKKAARREGYFAAKAAGVSVTDASAPVRVSLTFHPPTRNLPDEDNAVASVKSHLDGIADALGMDDALFRLERPVIAEPVKGGRVIVAIGDAG